MAWATLGHLFLVLRQYLDLTIELIFGFFWEDGHKKIPDLDKSHNILEESAVSLASKIKAKTLKSEDLVRACIERIKAVNPMINAVTDERFEAALNDAKVVDKKIEAGLTAEEEKSQPFLGVPFTAKESHAVEGMLHTLGIKSRQHMRVEYDAECVRLLKEAGAIPIAVSNIPEVNQWQESRNLVFGQTNNPYHTGRTVGGSSGGEAALAASLASPITLCSDIGGSTRMPAFYCGLFGHNPTAGVTSMKGSCLRVGKPDSMASAGFVAKHASDLAPLTKIVAANKADLVELDKEVPITDIKFFYTETARDRRVSPIEGDLRIAMKRVISKITEQVKSDMGPTKYYHKGFDSMYSLWRHEMTKEEGDFAALLTNNQGRADGLLELIKKPFGLSQYTLGAIFRLLSEHYFPQVDKVWAENMLNDLKTDLLAKLGKNGVLLFPSAPHVAPYHYSCFVRPYNFSYWAVLNTLRLPSTQVPLGLNSAGLPIGIQVVSAPYNDALCLSVAKHLEKEFGGFVPPCKIH